MKPFYSPSNFSARQKREHAERFLQSYGNDHNVRFVFDGPARTDGKPFGSATMTRTMKPF